MCFCHRSAIVLLAISLILASSMMAQAERPNVVLIMCDDLNDYVEGFGGHPQTRTPNLARLAQTGVSFLQAHCNIPICAPSRASMFCGIYPHHSGCYGFDRWDTYEVLRNSRTIMDHLRAGGYQTLGTGKLMHHRHGKGWNKFGHLADYGPFAFDGEERVAHPDVPAPFRDIGTIDGSFGPLISLAGRKASNGNNYSWQTGNWKGYRELRVDSPTDRDPTGDELNAQWTVQQISELSKKRPAKPFFLACGFLRPHTPLIVPQRFFDPFPLETLQLPTIKPGDAADTYAHTVRGDKDTGSEMFEKLVASYEGDQQRAIKAFLQAYLASVAAVDELIGQIIDAIDGSPFKDNTIIIVTSDHGWGMGEKDYLYKNSLWEESTRVPLIIRAPGVAKAGGRATAPVSLIDIFPTLIDLCGLEGDTRINEKGKPLDGHSLRPLLVDPASQTWNGPSSALTALYKWAKTYDPAQQSYSLRTIDSRYIRYENQKEELYDNATDPYEWQNISGNPKHASRLASFQDDLQSRLPDPALPIPGKITADLSAEAWKDKFFKRYPIADTNKDGKLSWPEYKAYKAQLDANKKSD